MIPAATRLARAAQRNRLRMLVYGGLLGVVAVALALPYLGHFMATRVPLVLAVALVGYLPRRSWREALILAVPVFAASEVESLVGSQVMACLILPLYVLTVGRARFASVVGVGLLMVGLLAIRLKTQFAGTALTWHDIQFFFLQFRANVGVMATQPTLLAYALAVILLFLLLGWAAWRQDRAMVVPVRGSALLVAAMASVPLVAWSGSEVLTSAASMRRTGVWHLGGIASAHGHVPLSRFLATVDLQPKWLPAAADTAELAGLAGTSIESAGAAAPPADIVVFLQESQFNPATIEGCPPSLCALPVFGAGAGTLAYGPLQVHVFGGGTWLTEFSLATGVPHTVFGDAGSFAPFNVAPSVRRSFVRSLRSAGYRTVAIYPVPGGMMNARAAYAAYGFDAFHDSTDLGLSGSFTTPDRVLHQAALRVLEQERQRGLPVYLMVVTIFNHGEHGVQMDRVPPGLREEARRHFDENEADNVADFVWRTREFQDTMRESTRALLRSDRPAVVAWFGDHQPPFGTAPGVLRRVRSAGAAGHAITPNRQTWYHVAGNTAAAPVATPQPLDVVFLPGLLAQAAGVPADDWIAANIAAREACGGLLQQCTRPAVRDGYLSYLAGPLKAFDLP